MLGLLLHRRCWTKFGHRQDPTNLTPLYESKVLGTRKDLRTPAGMAEVEARCQSREN